MRRLACRALLLACVLAGAACRRVPPIGADGGDAGLDAGSPGGDAGLDAGSPDAGCPGSTTDGGACPTQGQLVLFVWDRTWGPCPPGNVCQQTLEVGAGCQASFNDQGTQRTATLSAEDCASLSELVSQGSVLASLCSACACPQVYDLWETVTVELAEVTVQKNIAGCTGASHTSLREEVNRVRARYFP